MITSSHLSSAANRRAAAALRYNGPFMRPLAKSHGSESHLLVCVGLLLWLAAALASIWEVLALQPPDSPLHLGVLVGPVVQLRNVSFGLGTMSLVAGLLWPTAYGLGGGRAVALLLALGALLHVASLAYAASCGLLAVQLLDPRTDARLALYVRALGHALTIAALLALSIRLVRRGPPPSVNSPDA